jgi:archaeosine-15-forming tRNA-guanine transglycosylase
VECEAGDEAGEGKEVVLLLHVTVDEDVLPGDEHLVEDENGVVLVETAA